MIKFSILVAAFLISVGLFSSSVSMSFAQNNAVSLDLVTICHGHGVNQHTIQLPASQVQFHLDHGYLGPCQPPG